MKLSCVTCGTSEPLATGNFGFEANVAAMGWHSRTVLRPMTESEIASFGRIKKADRFWEHREHQCLACKSTHPFDIDGRHDRAI